MGVRFLPAVAVAVTLALVSSAVRAHSGGTDAYGCHTDSRTGDYHCHSGSGGGGGGSSGGLSPREGYTLALAGAALGTAIAAGCTLYIFIKRAREPAVWSIIWALVGEVVALIALGVAPDSAEPEAPVAALSIANAALITIDILTLAGVFDAPTQPVAHASPW